MTGSVSPWDRVGGDAGLRFCYCWADLDVTIADMQHERLPQVD